MAKEKKGLGTIIVRLMIVAGVLAGASFIPTVVAYFTGYPNSNVGENSIIYGADGKEIGHIQASKRGKTTLTDEQVSPLLRQAFLAIEDRQFYNEGAISPLGLLKAVFRNLERGSLDVGGSTITQQYVKNAYLSNEKNLDRKTKEVRLAFKVDHDNTKDQVLTKYVNCIPFGKGAIGVDDGAQAWFGESATTIKDPKDPRQVAKAAFLASLVQRPGFFDGTLKPKPGQEPPEVALQKRIIATLDGYKEVVDDKGKPINLVSPDVIEQAKRVDFNIKNLIETRKPLGAGTSNDTDPYLVSYIRDWLAATEAEGEKQLDTTLTDDAAAERGLDNAKRMLAQGGLKIYTTINPAVQAALVKSVNDDTKLTKLGLSTGSVILDPRSGAVVAMYGGSDHSKDGNNYALEADRQVGSAMKTVVLTDMVRKEISVQSVFQAPACIQLDAKTRPCNDDKKQGGGDACRLSIADAIAKSNNPVFLEAITGKMATDCSGNKLAPVAQSYPVSPHSVAELAHKMGADDSTVPNQSKPSKLDEVPSLALGASSITPLKLGSMAATIASGGTHHKPFIVSKITTFDGEDVSYEHEDESESVVDEKVTNIVNQTLTGVFTKGTAQGAQLKNRKLAGKTATTPFDARMIAWSAVSKDKNVPAYVCSTWSGYPDNRETSSKGGDVWGADVAQICSKTLDAALQGAPAVEFAPADLNSGTKIGLK